MTEQDLSMVDSNAMFACVVQTMDTTECMRCHKRPDLLFAWGRVSKLTIVQNGTVAARLFAEQAVEHLQAIGWRMLGDELLCPDCRDRSTSAG